MDYMNYKQKVAAFMIPVYAATMAAYLSFAKPNIAYAQEKTAAAASEKPFSKIDCLVSSMYDSKTDCEKSQSQTAPAQNQMPSNNLENTIKTESAPAAGPSDARWQPLQVSDDTYNKNSDKNSAVKPKKKSKVLQYVGAAVGVVLLYNLFKGKESSVPSGSGAVTPASDLSDAVNDTCNVNTEICGDEAISDDVSTSGFSAE